MGDKLNYIIYEVNLEVHQEIHESYVEWLQIHMKQMLTFDGFLEAHLFSLDQNSLNNSQDGWYLYTVQYKLRDIKCLESYLNEHASEMRQDGLNRFGDKFKASRRILNHVVSFSL
jgi:hypothetical protein